MRERLLFGLPAAAISLAILFLFPPFVFFLIALLLITLATREYGRLLRHWAPSAPVGLLLVLVPAAALALRWLLRQETMPHPGVWLLGGGFMVVLVSVLACLYGGDRSPDAALTLGFVAFGTLYFALPAVSLGELRDRDPWWVFALFAIVWLGDSGAYFIGSAIGRNKLAPRISPNKTWEGTIGGIVVSLLAAAVWSWGQWRELNLLFLAIAVLTAALSQVGDLVESMVKRGAGVKDSSNILPGHGGFYDRLDATLLGAPVFYLGTEILLLTA